MAAKIRWRLILQLSRVPGSAMNPVNNIISIDVGEYISRDKAQADADRWRGDFVTPVIEKEIEYAVWPKGSNFIDFFDNKEK